jgi:protocatechuate 3,4-dioxygenase beta subunit
LKGLDAIPAGDKEAEMARGKTTRREALTMLGVTGVALAAGCGSDTPASPTPEASPAPGTTPGACAVSPSETIGPFPSLADFVRSDIREGRPGTPVTLNITVVNANSGCSAVAGAVVDVWQTDAAGHYSQYAQGGYDGRGDTFLRGLQTTDAGGRATFTTVYPGWYAGRATHIHVEVTVNGRSVKVTQIAFPENVNAEVYASGVYASRGPNPTSNARDGIFSDSLASELATVSGSPANGYTAAFTVGVSL